MKHPALTSFPVSAAERDAWIVARRPERNVVDPFRPYAFLVEDERATWGEIVPVATIFLTNRECPWRCLMCDLWRNTLTESAPVGAIPTQIDYALQRLGAARQIKLYNSGSFFDSKAIPVADHTAIAERVAGFERVIVIRRWWAKSVSALETGLRVSLKSRWGWRQCILKSSSG
jgi:archaeosine synthase beta-subunit